jgi:hypothetical protein
VQLAGYETDPAHAVGPPDSVATFEVAGTSADLVVRSVQAIDPTQIKVLLEPDAPEELAPGDVQVEPGIEVLEVIRSPGYLSVVLSPETPLHSGSYHFTLAPGLAGPGGSATVREGRGNSIAFSVSPRVFPNPVRSSGVARFEWLTSGALVRVFDLAGREVWSAAAPAEGTVVWETDRAAPGVYLYRIEGPYPAEGKLAVVR